jgi:seryl-tRNA(Sec) selenium transferase
MTRSGRRRSSPQPARTPPHQRLAHETKVGKEAIAGLLAAIERYLVLDHAVEHARWLRVVGHWAQALVRIAGVRSIIEPYNGAGQPVLRLRLALAADGPSAGELVARLWDARPRIAVLRNADTGIWIGPDLVTDDETGLIADGVAAALTTRTRGATP